MMINPNNNRFEIHSFRFDIQKITSDDKQEQTEIINHTEEGPSELSELSSVRHEDESSSFFFDDDDDSSDDDDSQRRADRVGCAIRVLSRSDAEHRALYTSAG